MVGTTKSPDSCPSPPRHLITKLKGFTKSHIWIPRFPQTRHTLLMEKVNRGGGKAAAKGRQSGPLWGAQVFSPHSIKLMPPLRWDLPNAIHWPDRGAIIWQLCLRLCRPGTSSVPTTTAAVAIPSSVHLPCTLRRLANLLRTEKLFPSWHQGNARWFASRTPWECCWIEGRPTCDVVPSMACASQPYGMLRRYGISPTVPVRSLVGFTSCCHRGGGTALLPCRSWCWPLVVYCLPIKPGQP